MEILNKTESAQKLAQLTGKWALNLNIYLDLGEDFCTEGSTSLKPAPYLNFIEHGQVITDEGCTILCDSYEECSELYELTVGDDGPTAKNKFNGNSRVYALMISPTGELINENT